MRWHLLALAPLACWSRSAAEAQQPAIRAPDVTRDFAVPDAPAFLLVSPDPGAILRPQTTRDLGIALSQFRTASGAFALPRSFAIEFSPVILVRADYDAAQRYRAALSSLRISAASTRDTSAGAPTNLAFGLRYSAKDAAVYRATNDPLVARFDGLIQTMCSEADDSAPVIESGHIDCDELLTTDQRETIQGYRDQIRRRWSQLFWNADVVDIAFAVSSQTLDSTGADPQLRQVALWGTYAKRWGNWGQLLVGARAGWRKDSASAPSHQVVALGARLYAGRNGQKAYLELEDQLIEGGQASLRIGAGLELSLAAWAWFTASMIHEDNGTSPARTYTAFRLNTGLPGF